MLLLEVEPMNLGDDVRALNLELIEARSREPARGAEAARIWGRVLWALAGAEPWGLDFFSHLDRLRDFCARHNIPYRQANSRSIVIHAPEDAQLVALVERFAGETFGARAGQKLEAGDPELEGDLAKRGVDAYHHTFANYFYCAVCDFENGFLTLLSERLWAQEVVRRITPVLRDLKVEVRLPA
jgi:hypothetical protein